MKRNRVHLPYVISLGRRDWQQGKTICVLRHDSSCSYTHISATFYISPLVDIDLVSPTTRSTIVNQYDRQPIRALNFRSSRTHRLNGCVARHPALPRLAHALARNAIFGVTSGRLTVPITQKDDKAIVWNALGLPYISKKKTLPVTAGVRWYAFFSSRRNIVILLLLSSRRNFD